jgi:hypothetical protein
VRETDNLNHLHVPTVLKSGSLNFPEPSGPVQACNGIALPLLIFVEKKIYKMQHLEVSGTPVLYIGRTVFKVQVLILTQDIIF